MYLETLFSHSSYEVIVASPSRESFSEGTKDIPELFAGRVRFADNGRIDAYKLTKSYFLPIAKDLNCS